MLLFQKIENTSRVIFKEGSIAVTLKQDKDIPKKNYRAIFPSWT